MAPQDRGSNIEGGAYRLEKKANFLRETPSSGGEGFLFLGSTGARPLFFGGVFLVSASLFGDFSVKIPFFHIATADTFVILTGFRGPPCGLA